MKALEELSVSYCSGVDSKSAAALGSIDSIRSFAANETQLDDALGKVVQSWPRLQRLSLNETEVTDAILPFLRDKKQLSRLSLSGTAIDDVGLALLRTFPGLEEVQIARTRCARAGVIALCGNPNLRRIVSSKGVTTGDDIDVLSRQFPRISFRLTDASSTP
jgi:hypothetical protein